MRRPAQDLLFLSLFATIVITISSCIRVEVPEEEIVESKVETTQNHSEYPINSSWDKISSFTFFQDECEYRIFYATDRGDYNEFTVINLTKQKLELELLELQIEELRGW